jgi:hypothetical protein
MSVSTANVMHGVTNGQWIDGLALHEIAADHVSATIDLETDKSHVHGSFKAKVCPET